MSIRRLFLAFCLTCVSCLYCMAGSDLKIIQGDKKFLKELDGNFLLEFVWDGATYDDKLPLEEKFINLEALKPLAWSGFTEAFNRRNKVCQVVKNSETAKYKIIVKVDKMDQYFKVMGFIPSNATKMWGTLSVLDLSTNEKIAVINVSGVDGGANPSPDGTFRDCFDALGKQLSKFK